MGGYRWTPEDLKTLQTRRQTAQAAPQKATAPKAKTGASIAFDAFYALLAANYLPLPEREYAFIEGRRFRADYAWPAQKVIVERMGGIWAKDGSRAKRAHAMPLKILRDYEKANLAQLAGWTYLQYTPEQLDSGAVIETLKIRLGLLAVP